MDPIIRSVALSPVARRIGRRPPVAAPSPAAPSSQPTSSEASAPAPAVPASLKPVTTTPAAPSANEIKLEADLRARDAEIAQLRAQIDKIGNDLSALHAAAEKKGFAAGEAKGEKVATQLLQEKIEQAKALAVQLGQARGRALDDAEDTLVEIVHSAVCRMLGEQGAVRENVVRLVREAAAGARDAVTVRLHPDDVALLRSASGREAELRLLADSTVKLGGCIVDSGTGSLDARFETQLELLGAALLAVRATRTNGGGAA